MEIPRVHVHDNGVQTIGANQIFNIGTNQVFLRDIPRWLVDHPKTAIPSAPPATVIIGQPIIQMPGCVEAHELSDKNDKIIEDDENKVLVFCDAEYPSYDAMDYQPDQLQMVIEAPPPPVVEPPPAPDIDPPEVPPIPPTEEIECPAPNQPRVGDLTQNGEERVIGHEVQNGQCVVLYEETTAVERFLPSTNQVSTTAAIAVVATASAAATPLLLRVIKPVIKKLTTTIQRKLGKEPPKLSRNELNCNRYREKKGLPPFKRPKKSIINRYKKN
jgi:hypothetical protein|tara:strand:- start:54 stop:872 length:819 start_codon:yes stop_codon:yes gene_type:complete